MEVDIPKAVLIFLPIVFSHAGRSAATLDLLGAGSFSFDPQLRRRFPEENWDQLISTCFKACKLAITAKGDKPTIRKPGDKLTIRQHGDKPTVRKPGDKPTIRQHGDMPTIRKPGDKPTIQQPGDKPTIRKPGDKPTNRETGAEIGTSSGGRGLHTKSRMNKRPL